MARKPRNIRECKTQQEVLEYVKRRDTHRLEMKRLALARHKQKKAAAMLEPVKMCPKGHAVIGDNISKYVNGSGFVGTRCRTCHLESSRLARENERIAKAARRQGSGQIGRKYQPEFRELKRNLLEHQQRAEGIRR